MPCPVHVPDLNRFPALRATFRYDLHIDELAASLSFDDSLSDLIGRGITRYNIVADRFPCDEDLMRCQLSPLPLKNTANSIGS